jgi:hypothetical protein
VKFDADRVLARIQQGAPDECWPVRGWKNDGYGTYMQDGHEKRITHLVLERAGRPLLLGQDALHHCDNPPCCNAAHLYGGTNADNVRDMNERGRASGPGAGEKHPQAKLTDEEAERIRNRCAAGEKQSLLAAEYGVRQSTISMIVNRRRRK